MSRSSSNGALWVSPSRLVTGGPPLLHLWSIPEARRYRVLASGRGVIDARGNALLLRPLPGEPVRVGSLDRAGVIRI